MPSNSIKGFPKTFSKSAAVAVAKSRAKRLSHQSSGNWTETFAVNRDVVLGLRKWMTLYERDVLTFIFARTRLFGKEWEIIPIRAFSEGVVEVSTNVVVCAPDLPTKASVYKAPPPSVHSWTGFYAGGSLGGKWADTTWTTTSTSDLPGTIVDASSPRSFSPSGFRAGGYAGYNWQIATWVFGLEADFAWADKTKTATGIPGCTISCAGFPGPYVDVSAVKMDWDASVRARLGYLITPDLLIYGTGGVAWQKIEASGTCQHSSPDPQCTVSPGNPFETQTNKKTLTGWTVGGGLEKIYGNWILRGEYRYSQFGDLDGVLPFGAPGVTPGSDTLRYKLSVQTHIGMVGLAYKFGGPY